MTWYHFKQNNSGGSFSYNSQSGISVNVWIEADNEDHADSIAESIGLYFDGYGDCPCCGSRWSSADYCYNDKNELPPEPEETIKKDEFNSWGATKWRPEGEYETFVHPLGRPFYGAHAMIETVRKLTYGGECGYGISIRDYAVGDIYPVSEMGWDKDGNRHAPAPGYQFYRLDSHDYYRNNDGVRLQVVDDYGYAVFWFPTKKLAVAHVKEMNQYLDQTPRPKLVDYVLTKSTIPWEKFTPEVIPVFDDDIME